MSINNEKKSRFNYSKEAVKEAMAAIAAGMPILKASTKYKIPRSTLHNKRRSKNIDKKPGPDTVLTANEENTLVQWVLDCSNVGMPIAKQQLLNSVSMLLKDLNRDHPFTNGRPGNHWYRNFLNRNEKIVDRMSENISIARAAATEDGIRNWFANVEGYLQEIKLLDIHPSRVFSSHTVQLSNPKKNTENLSVQMTGSADGQLTCPMIVFTQEKLPAKVHDTLPAGWIIRKAEGSSVTAENFFEYIKDCFHPWLVANKVQLPVVLFLNGRVVHVTLSLTDFCKKHQIELMALHPNSLNLIHPMEMLFEPLRITWEQGLKKYSEAKKGMVLPKESIALLLKSILGTLDVAELLKEGFASSGLYPLLVDRIDFKKIPEKPVEKVHKERIEFGAYVPTESHKSVEEKMSAREFLQIFEQNMNPHTLQAFRAAEKSEVWTGRVEDTAFFYYWKGASAKASNENDSDGADSRSQSGDNNVDYSDSDFDNVNNFLEIQSLPEDPTEAEDVLKMEHE